MQTFRQLERHLGAVPSLTVRALSGIDRAAGLHEARRAQYADALDKLVTIARIQSTESSNAIENITAPRNRIEALVKDTTTPANRPEEEIAGYRDVLDTIHASAPDIPFTNNVLLQFHRDLYRYTPVRNAGVYKIGSNEVTETLPDGTTTVRFTPVAPGDTGSAMDELHDAYAKAVRAEQIHPLLLLSAYVFDFLMIHPFQDGNGRMSRLITLLLSYHAGYDVGRYVSLEQLIGDSRETYYEALAASTAGWHTSEHDVWPWIGYLLGIFTRAYGEFEQRLGTVSGRGSKTEAIKQFVRSSVTDTFTLGDVRRATPMVSDQLIRRVLGELRELDPPAVERETLGRNARYRRLRTDF